jgi:hypothetical protein
MVGVESGGVVFLFGGGLPEQNEGRGEGHVLRCLPFFLDPLKRVLSTLRGKAIEEGVLGIFRGPRIISIACGEDPHQLEPGAYREALVESQLD